MKRRIGIVGIFFIAFALTACGTTSPDSSNMSSGAMPMPGAEIAMDNKMAATTDNRAVIKTASIGVRVKRTRRWLAFPAVAVSMRAWTCVRRGRS